MQEVAVQACLAGIHVVCTGLARVLQKSGPVGLPVTLG
jgi:hypothetical protein